VRVLIDTTYVRRAPYSGTAVYLERLVGALSQLDDVEVIEVCHRRRRPPGGGGLRSIGNALADQWWVEVELPRRARELAADVIHHPLPARAHTTPTPQVVTVHDLAFERLPGCFDPPYRVFAHYQHRAAARGAAAVVCVSETTAQEARNLWGVDQGKLVVALHGPGQELPPPDEAGPDLSGPLNGAGPGESRYFLYVGDDEPRKDLATLLDGYVGYRRAAATPLNLVLAGSGLHGRQLPGVRCEHRPSAQRLAQLYAGAVALVHPALYEGFGLTPLEAMRLGTPVIAAAAPGITEICGDAPRYVDPRDFRGLALALAELADSESLRTDLAQRGRRRAAAYSWAASARRHLDAYSLARTR
jgi:glycosyltransferase involved in cell wall biosynthesis